MGIAISNFLHNNFKVLEILDPVDMPKFRSTIEKNYEVRVITENMLDTAK